MSSDKEKNATVPQTPYIPRSLSFDLSNEKNRMSRRSGNSNRDGTGRRRSRSSGTSRIEMSRIDATLDDICKSMNASGAVISPNAATVIATTATASGNRNAFVNRRNSKSGSSKEERKARLRARVEAQLQQEEVEQHTSNYNNPHLDSIDAPISVDDIPVVSSSGSDTDKDSAGNCKGSGIGQQSKRRTKSQFDQDHTSILTKKIETPLTIRKNIKRGRGSAGSITLQNRPPSPSKSSSSSSQSPYNNDHQKPTLSTNAPPMTDYLPSPISKDGNDLSTMSMLDSIIVQSSSGHNNSPNSDTNTNMSIDFNFSNGDLRVQQLNHARESTASPAQRVSDVFDLKVLDSILEHNNIDANEDSFNFTNNQNGNHRHEVIQADDVSDLVSEHKTMMEGYNGDDCDDNDFTSLLSGESVRSDVDELSTVDGSLHLGGGHDSVNSDDGIKGELHHSRSLDLGVHTNMGGGKGTDEMDNTTDGDLSLTAMMKKIEANTGHGIDSLDMSLLAGAAGANVGVSDGSIDLAKLTDISQLSLLLTPQPEQQQSQQGRIPDDASSKDIRASADTTMVKNGGNGSTHQQRSCNQFSSSVSCPDIEVEPFNVMTHTQHLEDILNRGGVKALDAYLERSDSDQSPISKSDSGSDNPGQGQIPSSFHTSFLENNASLGDVYLRASVKSLLIALRSVKAERKDVEDNLTSTQQQLKQIQDEYSFDKKHLENIIREKESQLRERHDELIRCVEKNHALEESNQVNVNRLRQTKSKLHKIESGVSTVQKKAEESLSRVVELEEQLSWTKDKDDELERLQHDLQDAQVKVSVLEMDLELKTDTNKELEIQLCSVRAILKENDVELSSVKRKLDVSERKSEKIELKLREAKKLIQSTEQASKAELSKMQDELSKAQEVRDEANELTNRLDDICAQFQDARHELEEKDNEISIYRENNSQIEHELIKSKNMLKNIHKELKGLDCDRNNNEDDCETLITHISRQISLRKEQLQFKEQDIVNLTNANDELNNKVAEASLHLEHGRNEIEVLETKVKETRETIKALENCSASKDEEISKLKGTVKELNEDVVVQSLVESEDLKQLRSDLSNAEEQVESLKLEMSSKDGQILKLNSALDDANLKMKSWAAADDSRIEAANDRILHLEEIIENRKKDTIVEVDMMVSKLRTKVDEVVKQNEEKSEENKVLRSSLHEAEASLDEAESFLDESEKERTTLKKQISAKDNDICNLRTTVDELKTALEEQKLRGNSSDAEAATCQKNLDKAETNTKELQQQLREKDDELRSLNTKIDELSSKLADQSSEEREKNTENEQLKTALREVENDRIVLEKQLHRKNDELAQKISSQNEQVERLGKDLSGAECRVLSLEKQVGVKEADVHRLTNSVNRLEAELNDQTSKDGARAVEIAILKSALDQAEHRVSTLQRESQEKDIEIADLQSSIEELERDLSTQTSKFEELKSSTQSTHHKEASLVSLEAENKQLKNQLSKKQLEREESIATLEDDNIKKMQGSLEGSENKLLAISDLNAKVNELQTDVDQLNLILEDKESLVADLQNEIGELKHFQGGNEGTGCDTELGLETKVGELQKEVGRLHLDLQNKEADIATLQRELKMSQLETMKASEVGSHRGSLLSSGSRNNLNQGVYTSLEADEDLYFFDAMEQENDELRKEIDQTESDAKEAIRELIIELNHAISDKAAAIDNLCAAQNELQTMREVCNQRELEILALESSLKKALTSTESDNSVVDDEVRQVIGELVQEIARIKASTDYKCPDYEKLKEKLKSTCHDLKMADETADLEAARADAAETMLHEKESEMSKVQEKLSNLIQHFAKDTLASDNSLFDIIETLSNLIDVRGGGTGTEEEVISEGRVCAKDIPKRRSTNSSDRSVESSGSHGSKDSKELSGITSDSDSEESKSFTAAIDQMFSQSSAVIKDALDDFSGDNDDIVIRSALDDFDSVCSDDNEDEYAPIVRRLPKIEFAEYESLMKKCNRFESEREELVNETFALMNASAAANAAEMEVVVQRIQNEAALKIQRAEERVEYFAERLASCKCAS